MDPRKRLDAGREAFLAGRYAEALAHMVWFHNNALKHDRAYYGVRLSFALGDWSELGQVYPPAFAKLRNIRDKKTRAIARGAGDYALFHDVGAINQELGEEHLTRDLFRHLDESNPELAKKCASLAFEALVKSGAFALAHRYFPDAEGSILRHGESFNHDMERHASMPRPHGPGVRDAFTMKYCEKAQMFAAILENVGQPENAGYVIEWGIALVEDKKLRAKVRRILATPGRLF